LHACWSADFHLPRAKKLILAGIGLLSTRWRFSYACLFFHQFLFFSFITTMISYVIFLNTDVWCIYTL
jgi:hypothetical protein